MSRRIPKIAKDVVNNMGDLLTCEQQEKLVKLHDDLMHDRALHYIDSELSEDASMWLSEVKKFKNKTWLEMPWFLSESYFFRVLLEYSGYFVTGNDPFYKTKENELMAETTWNHLSTALESSDLKLLLKCCLWGNKADGCYKAVKDTLHNDQENANLEAMDDLILVDDSDQVCTYLKQERVKTIHFINDNSGTELLLDLALADFLLRYELATTVTFNLKARPTYVSDTTLQDVDHTLEYIKQREPAFHQRLKTYVGQNRLQFRDHMFWNSFMFFWELPLDLVISFQRSDFVIIKGDANYRRLLGDRDWPVSTPFAEAVAYFPQSFVSLRTLKSDPIVGVSAKLATKLNGLDPKWRVNGVRGIIQSMFRSIQA